MIIDDSYKLKIAAISEALPYIQRFNDKIIIIKYGGNAMTKPELRSSLAKDVVLLKQVGMHPVIVHGGGALITKNIRLAKIESKFHNGLRITDDPTMSIVESSLKKINQDLVQSIHDHGGKGIPITNDHPYIYAQQKPAVQNGDVTVDYGRVGEIMNIDKSLKSLSVGKCIPVIIPIGVTENALTLNINADTVASNIATSLGAAKLILLTNQEGLLDQAGGLIAVITPKKAHQMVEEGSISGGMLPKIACSLHCADNGMVVHIIDGRVQHVVLLELLTDRGVGTMIQRDPSRTPTDLLK